MGVCMHIGPWWSISGLNMYTTGLPVRYTYVRYTSLWGTYTGELQVVTVECAQFKLHSSSCTAGSSGRPDAAQMYLSCLPQALPMQIPCFSLFTLCCIVVFTMWCIVVSRSPHIVVHRYASWCQMVRTLLSTAAAWPHKCSGDKTSLQKH